MDFGAESKTIESVFTQKKRIVIPRFQREFVWDKEGALNVFWDDILDNLVYKDNSIMTSEYFLGTLVLIDNKDDSTEKERAVIDGQQRLTAITVFFCALYEVFKKIGENKLADRLFSYVISEDNNGDPITLLNTESPKPFFQQRIQGREKDHSLIPVTNEEKRLFEAYNFFYDKLAEDNLKKEIRIRAIDKEYNYLDVLKIIRDQVLQCKVVYVSVKSMKDAYMIFEVLNAKGEPLNAVELIKNSIFKILNTTEPIDDAAVLWSKIKDNIESDEELEVFYRHFWISKYHFVTQKKLFMDFEERIKDNKTVYKSFLKELSNSALNYQKIINPKREHWNTSEKLQVYYSLMAFKVFNVTQVRTILLSLLDSYDKKKIKLSLLKGILVFLENFHFVFSAICSSRPSGLESRYSKYAIMLNNENDKSKIPGIIKSLKEDIKRSVPSYDLFSSKMANLWFTDEEQKDKKKIQYIFGRIERMLQSTFELEVLPFSLEHISSQSSDKEYVGKIGNLLPLSEKINSDVGNKPYSDKIKEYSKSELKCVKDFLNKYGKLEDWTEENVNTRTKLIIEIMYKQVCVF